MWFGIVTLFPEMVAAAARTGVVGRAIDAGLVSLEAFDPREHATDRHQTVDDRPYGGGPGMVLQCDPIDAAIRQARTAAGAKEPTVVYLTPEGQRFDHRLAVELAGTKGLVLLCGRYEGVDERVVEASVERRVSLGDFVVSGGELPALVIVDAITRLRPGVLGNAASAGEESYLDGTLDYPHYTRPEMAVGRSVPPVLLGGDHREVARWRRKQALKRTFLHRPDLLSGRRLSMEDRVLLEELFQAELRATQPAQHVGRRADTRS